MSEFLSSDKDDLIAYINDNDLSGDIMDIIREFSWDVKPGHTEQVITVDAFDNKIHHFDMEYVGDFNRACDEGVYQKDVVFKINGQPFIYREFWDSWGAGDYDNELYLAKPIVVHTFAEVEEIC